jgi:hypothetical protein
MVRPLPVLRALGPLIVIWALVLADLSPLFGGAIPWNQDIALYFLPFKVAGIDLLRRGHLPLWTPLAGLGYPLLADGQAAVLYPPDVALFLAFPPFTAFDASIVAHVLLGSSLFYAFLRRIGLGSAAAVLGSIVFTFSGPLLPLAGTPRLSVAAWWPGLLLAVDAILRRPLTRHSWWILAGAIVTALMFTAGFPQVAVEGVLIAVAYAMDTAWRLETDCEIASQRSPLTLTLSRGERGLTRWRDLYPIERVAATARGIIPVALSITLGLGLAAPQLLATIELAGRSVRASGLGALTGQGSLFPPALIELITPSWSALATLGDESPNAFVGVIVVTLSLSALFVRKPDARFWGAMALVSVFLAIGRFTPVGLLLGHLPGFSYFRIPARFLYVASTALAVLAALGLDELLNSANPKRVALLARAGCVLAGAAVAVDALAFVALHLAGSDVYALVGRVAGTHKVAANAGASHLFLGALAATDPTRPGFWAPIVGLLGLGLFALALRRGSRRLAGALAVVGCLAELQFIGVPISDVTHPAPPATVATIHDISFDVGAYPRIYSFAEPFHAASAGRYDLLPANSSLLDGIPTIGLYAALGDPSYQAFLEPLGAVDLAFGEDEPTLAAISEHRRLLDLLGASIVVSPVPLSGFGPAGQIDGVYLYRNQSAYPRAWMTSRARQATSDVRTTLEAPTADLDQVAFVDPASASSSDLNLQPEKIPGEATAAVVSDDGDRIVVSAAGPGVLVLADRWASGWHATVDGIDAPIWRVDGILRGVPLTNGSHQVIFTYQPEGFWRGVWIAIASAAMLVVGVGWVTTRR